MASEALIALGRADVVERWAEAYATVLRERPAERNSISGENWREALGDISRVGDWTAFFAREVQTMPWPQLLAEWAPRLLPGVMAGATHGIIRTAHAVRSLERGPTPQRIHELAEGLGYWAARYQVLPAKASRSPRLPVAEAISSVVLVPDALRRGGLIFNAVRVLDEASFGPAIDLVEVGDGSSDDVDAFVTELTRAFVREYMANADRSAIGFVHTVTAPAALRILAPLLPAHARRDALRFTWQACAAIYATYGGDAPREISAAGEVDEEDLIDRAVSSGDEHAIKFTEACLREHRLSGDPAFLHAASDAADRLRRG